MMGIEDSKGHNRAFFKKLVELKEHLSLVFHRYLAGEVKTEFSIEFNGDPLIPMDPFISAKSTKPFAEDTYELAKTKIKIQPYILPHPKYLNSDELRQVGDLQKDQGFYIYRNKRLIIWGSWFRLMRKSGMSKLARVRVDIPASAALDKLWSLDVKKSTALIPEELKDSLRTVVDKLSGKSKRVWTQRAKRQCVDGAMWTREKDINGVITYDLDYENVFLKQFLKKNPEVRKLLDVVVASMPLDAIYSDLSNEEHVSSLKNKKTKEDWEKVLNEMKKDGFDIDVDDLLMGLII